jgi:serine/threonine-protein kinase mTOR
MQVLRENRESLLAVLEAFVYDPLLNWRLMRADTDTHDEGMNYLLKDDGSLTEKLATARSLRESQVDPAGGSKLAPHPQGHARKPKTDEKDIFNG